MDTRTHFQISIIYSVGPYCDACSNLTRNRARVRYCDDYALCDDCDTIIMDGFTMSWRIAKDNTIETYLVMIEILGADVARCILQYIAFKPRRLRD